MVLSIGMIVKNEEKYLEKCLTALQPILNELDSELIIADTGSTDRTVEIAKRFTDNVFYFEWINDFAAARNSTLERSQGEWYMFVDADEIVQNSNELIRFFQSGEYRRYMSAGYTIRSYTDTESFNSFVDFKATRLVKKLKETEFIHPIHESISPILSPTKFLNVIFDHYGYLYSTNGAKNELAEQKANRNLEFLFKELNEKTDKEINDEHFFLYDQIADCYDVLQEPEKALEYLDMGLNKLDHNFLGISSYYSHKIIALVEKEKFEEAISLSDEFFDTSVNPWHTKDFATDCAIYSRRGYSHYKLKKYANAIEDYKKLIEIYGKYKKGRLNDNDLFYSTWKTGDVWILSGFDIFFRCCYQEHRYALAESFARAIPLEEYKQDHSMIDNHIRIRVEIMDEVGYKNLDYLFEQLDDHGKAFLLCLVRGKMEKSSLDNRKIVTKKLAVLGKTNALAEIYYEYLDKGTADPQKIEDYLALNGSEDSEDLLFILLEQQNDITPFLQTRDFFADRSVQFMLNNYPGCIKLFENYNIAKISDEGLERATSLYGWVQLRAMERGLSIVKIFELYGKLGVRWYDEFESDNMPGDIRAALLVNNVCAAHGQLDVTKFKEAIHELRAGVADLDPVITAYFNEVKGDFAKKNDPTAQMAALAAQVKQNIRVMINAGNIDEAQNTLSELAALCPGDPELDTLQKDIAAAR